MTAPETREITVPPGGGLESPEPNQHGRAHAMTVFSLLRPVLSWPPGGVYLQRLLLGIGSRRPPYTIRRLSFIHFARLTIIRQFPDHRQPRETIREPLMLFESNYNGTFDQYIDAFATAIPGKMTALWNASYGFPGIHPVSPFKAFVRANEFTAEHYYSAYPTATATMIVSALKLKRSHEEFYKRALMLKPPEFARDFRAFVTRVQADL